MGDNVWDSKASATRRAANKAQLAQDASPEIPIMINALKKLYKDKLLPLEQAYNFGDFATPSLQDAYFEAKPFVLLCGQYSVGKTTFIQYLLERDFPNMRIGPEPTTDRFMVLMSGPTDRAIPGNALAADNSKPFTALNKFGMGFLDKFECIECQSPILERVSFIDTPGILSGEKQRIGRTYDFPEMVSWFAEMSDRILLLFDAHKLDISDEFKMAIERIRSQDDKVKVVLNKADIETQNLLRVYGALMWSLGKVFNTPEVLRVYVGSFWDAPLRCKDNEKLLELEEKDLLADLRSLPKNVAVRKVNEIIKRARRVKVHTFIILHLKEQFGMFGKDSTQKKLLENLGGEFKTVMEKNKVPKNDFPDINKFRDSLKNFEIHKFPKLKKELMIKIDELLSSDMPKLMSMVPQNFDGQGGGGAQTDITSNPFEVQPDKEEQRLGWAIDGATKAAYDNEFEQLPTTSGRLSGQNARDVLVASGLDTGILRDLWNLSDIDQDGWLDSDEFAVARFLIDSMKKGLITALPTVLPDKVIPPSKRHLFDM